MYLTWIPAKDVHAGDRIACLLSDASAYPEVTGWHDETLDLTRHGLGIVVHRVFTVSGAPWWVGKADLTGDLSRDMLIAAPGPSPEGKPTYENRRSYRLDGCS